MTNYYFCFVKIHKGSMERKTEHPRKFLVNAVL